MLRIGWRRLREKPDEICGSNLSGDRRKNRFSRPAGRIVIPGWSTGGLEAERDQVPALVHELRRGDGPVADEAAVAHGLLRDQMKGIARLQVGVEIDFSREDVGERDAQIGLLTRTTTSPRRARKSPR